MASKNHTMGGSWLFIGQCELHEGDLWPRHSDIHHGRSHQLGSPFTYMDAESCFLYCRVAYARPLHHFCSIMRVVKRAACQSLSLILDRRRSESFSALSKDRARARASTARLLKMSAAARTYLIQAVGASAPCKLSLPWRTKGNQKTFNALSGASCL